MGKKHGVQIRVFILRILANTPVRYFCAHFRKTMKTLIHYIAAMAALLLSQMNSLAALLVQALLGLDNLSLGMAYILSCVRIDP
jgi:hypothetical protein